MRNKSKDPEKQLMLILIELLGETQLCLNACFAKKIINMPRYPQIGEESWPCLDGE